MHWWILVITTFGLISSFILAYWFTYKWFDKNTCNYISWIIGSLLIIISTGITIGLSFISQNGMVITSAFIWGLSMGYWSGLIWYKLRYRELKRNGGI